MTGPGQMTSKVRGLSLVGEELGVDHRVRLLFVLFSLRVDDSSSHRDTVAGWLRRAGCE